MRNVLRIERKRNLRITICITYSARDDANMGMSNRCRTHMVCWFVLCCLLHANRRMRTWTRKHRMTHASTNSTFKIYYHMYACMRRTRIGRTHGRHRNVKDQVVWMFVPYGKECIRMWISNMIVSEWEYVCQLLIFTYIHRHYVRLFISVLKDFSCSMITMATNCNQPQNRSFRKVIISTMVD